MWSNGIVGESYTGVVTIGLAPIIVRFLAVGCCRRRYNHRHIFLPSICICAKNLYLSAVITASS